MENQTNFKDDFDENDKVETKFWKPENEGDSLIGYFKSIDEGQYGNQFIFDTSEGTLTVGSYTALVSKLNKNLLGKKIKIVYLGEKKAERGGRTYKAFEVFTK